MLTEQPSGPDTPNFDNSASVSINSALVLMASIAANRGAIGSIPSCSIRASSMKEAYRSPTFWRSEPAALSLAAAQFSMISRRSFSAFSARMAKAP